MRKCECGCGQRVADGKRFVTHHNLKKHGLYNTREHRTWSNMMRRCEWSNEAKDRAYYQDRNISVCKRWRNSFAAFLEDMGAQPPGTTIDRIDNSIGYGPFNCRWATIVVQNSNRTTCRYITAFGEKKTAAEWSRDERARCKAATIYARSFKYGWDSEDAITTPARKIKTVKNRWWKRGPAKAGRIFDRSQR